MSDSSKAVFLSYASQDAQAARRICEALRAAEPVADLCENVRLTTAAENYAWVQTRQIWGIGIVNLAAGTVHIDGYMQ